MEAVIGRRTLKWEASGNRQYLSIVDSRPNNSQLCSSYFVEFEVAHIVGGFGNMIGIAGPQVIWNYKRDGSKPFFEAHSDLIENLHETADPNIDLLGLVRLLGYMDESQAERASSRISSLNKASRYC